MKVTIEIGMIFYILNHKKTTAKTLAEKFEVSTKTIYRYLDEFSACGIPIITECGKNGGIRIENTFNLLNMFFSNEELEKLKSFCKNDIILFEKLDYIKSKNKKIITF
ncbi:MAG: HTH domain-containing protein [Clostridia bacterium]|nr:HTH domain-containing protein [Clostridia bacterium]